MTLPNYAFFNGKIIPYQNAKVGVLTHALNYGTACFGGIRGYWNEDEQELFVFRPQDHYRRFLESAKLLDMKLGYDANDLVNYSIELLRTENLRADCYIRPLAFYRDEIIGCRVNDLTPEVAIVAIPFGRYIQKEEGAHVTISSWRRLDDNMIPARGKIAGAYVNSAIAKTDALRAGFDEAIILNQDGHVSEGSAENVFVIRNAAAITPPVTDNILEGIVRRTVCQMLRDELQMQVVERSIDRSELYLAEEIFFCGTGVQIAAVTCIDHRPVGAGKIGAITSWLRDMFFNAVRGRHQKYRHWCTPVYSGS